LIIIVTVQFDFTFNILIEMT